MISYFVKTLDRYLFDSAIMVGDMFVLINNESIELPDGAKLEACLRALKLGAGRGLALAVNDVVVARLDWQTYNLAPGDHVTIIRAFQGG